MAASKTFVLGAGASMAYGFPSGRELRQRILAISESSAKAAGIIRERTEFADKRKLEEFLHAFKHSQMYSIDAFLGRRREFVEIGKKCIAMILLGCENSKNLFSETPEKDHWYQYIFNQIAHDNWDELTFDDIAIISFNYDRSLEHFLYETLQSTYGRNASEVAEKLKTLRVVHVYGCLSNVLPNEHDYIKYDGKLDVDKVEEATAGLVVIPEGRNDSPTLQTARSWLEHATAICFLGFGFDATNVARLAEQDACALWKQLSTGHTQRNIVGTSLGMTHREIAQAFGILAGRSLQESGEWRFRPTTCTRLLRETLFLG